VDRPRRRAMVINAAFAAWPGIEQETARSTSRAQYQGRS